MRYYVTMAGRTVEVELGSEGIRVDGEPAEVDLVEMDGTQVRSLLLNGKSYRVLAARKGRGSWNLHLYGRHLDARVVDERTRALEEMTGEPEGGQRLTVLRAPMPGLVVKVDVAEGDPVKEGQGLVIVEAMKMENELKSLGEARVKRVLVGPGDVVEKDQVLVEFHPPEPEEETLS
jgi:pyruvate carboxylase subunit B